MAAAGEQKINLKQLIPVIVKDEGDVIKRAKKGVCLIDESERATTFLKYQSINYLNAQVPTDILPETIRKALLGAIRFGKHFVIDVGDNDGLWKHFCSTLEAMKPANLLDMVLKRTILEDDNFMKMVKDGDSSEYTDVNQYPPEMIANFIFVVGCKTPPKDLPPAMLMYRVE